MMHPDNPAPPENPYYRGWIPKTARGYTALVFMFLGLICCASVFATEDGRRFWGFMKVYILNPSFGDTELKIVVATTLMLHLLVIAAPAVHFLMSNSRLTRWFFTSFTGLSAGVMAWFTLDDFHVIPFLYLMSQLLIITGILLIPKTKRQPLPS